MSDQLTALFYTFSTIAQTLAGAIALLGAFVLYRLQTLGVAIEAASLGAIQPHIGGDQQLHLMHVAGKYEVLQFLNARRPAKPPGPVTAVGLAHQDKLEQLLKHKREILELLRKSLLSAVLLIIVAVVVLAIAPSISRSIGLTVVVFVVHIVWFAGCFALFGVLVWRALR